MHISLDIIQFLFIDLYRFANTSEFLMKEFGYSRSYCMCGYGFEVYASDFVRG